MIYKFHISKAGIHAHWELDSVVRSQCGLVNV